MVWPRIFVANSPPSSAPIPVAAALQADQHVAFDALRGLLALMLVLLHMSQSRIEALPTGWMHQRLVSVALFFTLSGFLVTRSVLRGASFDRRSFTWARCRRILPPYFILLFFAIAVVDADDLIEKPLGWAMGNLASHATLTHAWFDGHSSAFLTPLWTLSHEWTFYAFLLLAGGAIRSRWWWAVVAGMMVLAAAARLGVRTENLTLANDYRHPFCIMDLFAPGIAAAVLAHRFPALFRRKEAPWTLLALGLALAGWALWRHYDLALRLDDGVLEGMAFYAQFDKVFTGQRSNVFFYQPALALGTALLLLALWHWPGPVARLVRWTPLPWMGKISYSTYLWHMATIACFSRAVKDAPTGAFWRQPWPTFLLVLLVVYGLSAVAWHFFERPYLKPKPLPAADTPPAGASEPSPRLATAEGS